LVCVSDSAVLHIPQHALSVAGAAEITWSRKKPSITKITFNDGRTDRRNYDS